MDVAKIAWQSQHGTRSGSIAHTNRAGQKHMYAVCVGNLGKETTKYTGNPAHHILLVSTRTLHTTIQRLDYFVSIRTLHTTIQRLDYFVSTRTLHTTMQRLDYYAPCLCRNPPPASCQSCLASSRSLCRVLWVCLLPLKRPPAHMYAHRQMHNQHTNA